MVCVPSRRRPPRTLATLSATGGVLLAVPAFAQEIPATPADLPDVPQEAEPSAQPHDFSFIALPVPVSDPAIGTGLAVVAGVLYKAGGSERPWVTGAAGLYTDNGSWAAALVQKAYIADDRFRVTAAGGVGEFNVDFFGVGPGAGDRGVSIPITQSAGFVGGQALMRVAPNFYAGLQYRLIDMATTINVEDPPFPDLDIPTPELDSVSSALGISAEYDTRDNEYQPGEGLYATGVWLAAAEFLGSDHDYSRAEAAVNGYHRMDEKSVIAWRASVCWAGDAAPFYDICNFGSRSDLRGYLQGQYRDHAMYAIQLEYRRRLFGRFGGVVFAGVGEVAPSFGELESDNVLPAGGVGIRFEASRKYRVNVGVDVAVGRDGEAVYFRVSEAF